MSDTRSSQLLKKGGSVDFCAPNLGAQGRVCVELLPGVVTSLYCPFMFLLSQYSPSFATHVLTSTAHSPPFWDSSNWSGSRQKKIPRLS